MKIDVKVSHLARERLWHAYFAVQATWEGVLVPKSDNGIRVDKSKAGEQLVPNVDFFKLWLRGSQCELVGDRYSNDLESNNQVPSTSSWTPIPECLRLSL